MKIGILTYHCVPNFGAQLQTISTIGYLKKLGHEPIVLNWYPLDLEKMYANRVPTLQIEEHNKFTDEFIPITKLCRTESDLVNEVDISCLDCIIIGSDALFKFVPERDRSHFSLRQMKKVHREVLSVEEIVNNPFFCSFYEKLERKIPICGLSVSSQNSRFDMLTVDEHTILKKSFSYFSFISVRDEWTKQLVEHVSDFRHIIQVTPDPIFSFNQNCYIPFPSKEDILKKFNLPDNYILLSFRTDNVSPKYINEISALLVSANYCPVAFPMPEGLKSYSLDKKIDLPLSPIDWYSLIMYSKGYIGERMHPIIVCVHNCVPFYSFDEYGMIERKMFGLLKNLNVESSKTFHILNKAGLTRCFYSYYGRKALPKAKEIINAINNFELKKCQSFALSIKHEYDNNMSKINRLISAKCEV